MEKSWSKRKRNGAIKRKLAREYSKHDNEQLNENQSEPILCERGQVSLRVDEEGSAYINSSFAGSSSHLQSFTSDSSTSDEENDIDINRVDKNSKFRESIRKWAVENNITHVALRDLAKICNERIDNILPKDPRAILNTARNISLKSLGDGEYWHHGLTNSLKKVLAYWVVIPNTVYLNINMDGLPIFKSSKKEFWPILYNIHNSKDTEPFIIGIYFGNGKPKNLSEYLEDFVTEANSLLRNGIILSNKNIRVNVKIRCFICDSPARAYIKGVCNFNGKHGCLKCTTVGEYSHNSHTVVFPKMECPDRTDEMFRAKQYGDHHKADSPLLQLPIDMVEDFPVADSLHLIDLGVMKRLLVGWRDGNFGKYITKWCARNIETVSNFLLKCILPSEIHRPLRGLDCLAHWKASEYRSFLFYASIIILPDVLPENAFKHFLNMFCSITICTSDKYKHLLPLASELLQDFVKHYKDFYGEGYVTSNVHNLLHVVKEVQRFGPLQTFNAYPFENKLYMIKRLLRNGKKPLAQVAKRLSEDVSTKYKEKSCDIPYVTKIRSTNILNFKNFKLSSKPKDRYFMTKKGEVMGIKKIIEDTDTNLITMQAFRVTELTEIFDYPIKSSYLDMYKAKVVRSVEQKISPREVQFKFVSTQYKDELFFIPLLHTLGS